MTFSRRLPWASDMNPLAAREAELRAAGRDLVDLTVTNPTAVGIPYPEMSLPVDAAYAPTPFGLPEARTAVAADFARRGVAVDPAAIVLTASSSESYGLLFKLLADPGQAVLVPQPSYPLFDYLARLEGVEPRPYQLVFDGSWRIDWDSVRPQGACAICLVSPNNPTGSYVTRGDLTRASGLGLPLVVDEVFADYPLAPAADAVRCVRDTPALTFSLGGLSKAAGLPQVKLGWIAVTGPGAAEALRRLDLMCDTYLSVGTPVQQAAPRLITLGAEIRARIAARVQENRRQVAAAVSGTGCTLLPTEAGWSALLRLPAVMTDEEWALALLDEGVLVQPGYFFDIQLPATLVISLLPPLRDGITRIVNRVSRL